MQEIELKAKINDFTYLATQLELRGCKFSAPIFQEDIIFLKEGDSFPQLPPNAVVLRIRFQNSNYKFTLKKHLSNELDCIEKETEISNPVEFADSLKIMGYYEAIGVKKSRIKTSYKNYNITLDDVEGLGKFIEIEVLAEEHTVDARIIQQEIIAFLRDLGVKDEELIFESYDVMLSKSWSKKI